MRKLAQAEGRALEDYLVPYEVPARAHKVLGEVRVSAPIKPTFKATSTFDQVMNEMKKQARKVGADAIVDLKTIDSTGDDQNKLTMVGTFIIYTQPPDLSNAH